MAHGDKALQLFSQKFNCAQAVFGAFAEDFGLEEELALRLAASFGGGARNGELCGAVSGALMVLGLQYGHCRAEDIEQKQIANAKALEFTKRFKAAHGALVCRELLAMNRAKICPLLVKSAAEIAEAMLAEA